MVDMNIIKDLVDSVSPSDVSTNNNYFATVTRTDEEGVVWVQIAGAEKETPTAVTSAEVKKGDLVSVEWRNNKLYLAGNYTNPSAGITRVGAVEQAAQVANILAEQASYDASRAKEAADSAEVSAGEAKTSAQQAITDAATAGRAASVAQSAAEAAQATADTKKTVFITQPTPPYHVGDMWAKLGEDLQDMITSAGDNLVDSAGDLFQAAILTEGTIYVCTVPKLAGQTFAESDWELATADEGLREWFWHDADGAHVLGDETGFRNDITSTGMKIMDTSTETSVAEFGSSGAQIGKDGTPNVQIQSTGIVETNDYGVSCFEVNMNGGTHSESMTTYDDQWFDVSVSNMTASDSSSRTRSITLSGYNTGDQVVVFSYPGMTDYDVNGNFYFVLMAGSGYVPTVTITSTNVESFYRKTVPNPSGLLYGVTLNPWTITIGTNSSYSADFTVSVDSGGDFSLAVSATYTASTNKVQVTATITYSGAVTQPAYIMATADGNINQTVLITTKAPSYSLGQRLGDAGIYSAIIGEGLYSTGEHQTSVGRYNIEDDSDEYAFIVGNGTAKTGPSNALTVDWSGNVVLAGGLTVATPTETFSGTVGSGLSGSCNGIYDTLSKTVRINFQVRKSTDISTSDVLFTIPSAYRPSAAVSGSGVVEAYVSSTYRTRAYEVTLDTSGQIKQGYSNYARSVFGVFEYSL